MCRVYYGAELVELVEIGRVPVGGPIVKRGSIEIGKSTFIIRLARLACIGSGSCNRSCSCSGGCLVEVLLHLRGSFVPSRHSMPRVGSPFSPDEDLLREVAYNCFVLAVLLGTAQGLVCFGLVELRVEPFTVDPRVLPTAGSCLQVALAQQAARAVLLLPIALLAKCTVLLLPNWQRL